MLLKIIQKSGGIPDKGQGNYMQGIAAAQNPCHQMQPSDKGFRRDICVVQRRISLYGPGG